MLNSCKLGGQRLDTSSYIHTTILWGENAKLPTAQRLVWRCSQQACSYSAHAEGGEQELEAPHWNAVNRLADCPP